MAKSSNKVAVDNSADDAPGMHRSNISFLQRQMDDLISHKAETGSSYSNTVRQALDEFFQRRRSGKAR